MRRQEGYGEMGMRPRKWIGTWLDILECGYSAVKKVKNDKKARYSLYCEVATKKVAFLGGQEGMDFLDGLLPVMYVIARIHPNQESESYLMYYK